MAASTKIKGRYELKEVLAKGGMGVVYRAVDGVMKRQVAIKTLLDITDPRGLELFQKECDVLASMTHPNIIEIYDVGHLEEDGISRPYLVMPLLPGVTLDQLIRTSSQRLTVERSLDIACQACRGLHAAHEKGLIHRDIKPSNIFVLEDDSIKIIDFGVAHRVEGSRTVGRKGTLLYMAPEQIAMKPLSAVSDIFSLGVVCYEMLTHRRPFDRATENSVADAILHFIPVPASELNPAVSQSVSQAIHKAMAKQPWHRYSTAREFADTLQKALRNEPIEIFNPVRVRPRLQRAAETLERGDLQYASEIVSELEGEGHLDPAISELRRKIDDAIRGKTVAQLLETAHSRIETEEYPLALQKIYDVLQLDPTNAAALSLKVSVENKRAERDMEEWFRLADEHLERFDFKHAREALERVLQLRPQQTRALQLLSEVSRLEQEHSRTRHEKEQLYQAALAAEQRGDISSALSKLERVLELDRRIPEAGAPERASDFQKLYDKVRSEHEEMQRAYGEAKQRLQSADFASALSICSDQLARYPENALFHALKIDIEERHRQALSARIAETDRKVDAEPDLDRRIAIVEDAVRANPGERHFEQLLQRTREKQNLIESIVVRARMHEQQAQFSEALSQWEILKNVYDRYPGLSMEMDRVLRRRDQHLRDEAKNRWVEEIDRMLATRTYHRALELLGSAQAEHPGDPELEQLARLARQGLEKAAEAQRLAAEGRAECTAGRYAEGMALLTRAYQFDDRNLAVRAALLEALVERARGLIDSEPDAAEPLLRQALNIDPDDGNAKGLLSVLEDQRYREAVDRCVAEVRQLQSDGDLLAATAVVQKALLRFSGEPRLVQLQASVKKGLEEVRRRDIEEVTRIRQDAGTARDRPTLDSYSTRLDEITLLYSDDSEFLTAAAAARSSLQRPAIPPQLAVAPSMEEPVGIEPVAQALPPAPARGERAKVGWLTVVAMVKARPKVWAGGIAGLSALLVIAAVSLNGGRKLPPPPSQSGTLEITTSPQGAVVLVNGEQRGTATSALLLPVRSGSVAIEARLPGFRIEKTVIKVSAGERRLLPLILTPVLVLRLSLPAEASVKINDGEPVTSPDGQLVQELPVGTYSVQISTGRNSGVAFSFEVRPEGPAAITVTPRAQQVAALIVSNFGDQTRVYTGGSPVDVKLDGKALGQLGQAGMELPKLTPAIHELEFGEGRDLRKKSIEAGPERSLTAVIDSDPNAGTLLVKTNEDDVVITLNGKEVKRRSAVRGPLRIPNLKAGKYSVRAAKQGYDVEPAEQQVEIQKGEDTNISFLLRVRQSVAPSSARILLTPGSEIFVDGSSIGVTQGDTRTLPLKPATHTFRAEKGKQFRPEEGSLTLGEGETKEIDLRLTPLPVPVDIKKRPSDSKVTYSRKGDPAVRTFNGTHQELTDGYYTFTADATGYLQKRWTGQVSWDTAASIDLEQEPAPPPLGMTDWGRGAWTEGKTYFARTEAGFISFPKPLSYVQFTVNRQGGKAPVQWRLNYVNERNYIRCELGDDGFQAVRVSETNATEVSIGKKSVPKADWYTISISVQGDVAAVRLHNGANTELLGNVPAKGAAETRFGFYVYPGQQLHLANFEGRASR